MKPQLEKILEWGKKKFHFTLASYFWFFAHIRLKRWKPEVIVITGSNGKTSTLNLVETVLGEQAVYSHKANSSYGLAFFLLSMKRISLRMREWPYLFWHALINLNYRLPEERIFVAEADCDRPHEGEFLGKRLRPAITIWLNTARTHAMNFETRLQNSEFSDVQDAISYEFGNFLKYTSGHCIVNCDDPRLMKQCERTSARIHSVSINTVEKYALSTNGTQFTIHGEMYHFRYVLPKEFGYSILAALTLAQIRNIPLPTPFDTFELPPSRSSIFEGINGTTIMDSSYNANANSMAVILDLVKEIPAKRKIAVIGALLEQGSFSEISHHELADSLYEVGFDEIVLNGSLVKEFTLPRLLEKGVTHDHIHVTATNKEAFETTKALLQPGDLILVKGGRQEGIVEHLLAHPEDIAKLCRREEAFELLRKQEGL